MAILGFPKCGQLVRVGKMAKNCMKTRKPIFLGQNSEITLILRYNSYQTETSSERSVITLIEHF